MTQPSTKRSVEQWMRDAANELGNIDIDEFQRQAMAESDWNTDRADALILERLADIIARHCPEPASLPIRRGDVVQDANPAGNHDTMIVLENYGKSMEVWVMGGCVRTINSFGLVRIGRAAYYPDGTKVED